MPKTTTAADIMTKKLVTVTPETNVMEAVSLLLKHKISGAPVVDGKGKLVGILSELDCVNHMCHRATENLPPLDVGDLMTKEVVTTTPTATLLTLADAFARHRYRRLPVLDEGRLVGQVSRRDLLRALNDIMRKRQDVRRGSALPERHSRPGTREGPLARGPGRPGRTRRSLTPVGGPPRRRRHLVCGLQKRSAEA